MEIALGEWTASFTIRVSQHPAEFLDKWGSDARLFQELPSAEVRLPRIIQYINLVTHKTREMWLTTYLEKSNPARGEKVTERAAPERYDQRPGGVRCSGT